MPYRANVYQVVIVSPGDVPKERQLARTIVHNWNSINSQDKKICLLPVGWEYNSSPEMGGRAQEFINKQVLEDSDLLIGIFWTRIGSPTGTSISGSVEEIEKHVNAGKPAMLYFSDSPVIPSSINQKQYNELQKFRKKCFKKGLVESFDFLDDLSEKLTRQLALKIIQNDYFKVNDSALANGYDEGLNGNTTLLTHLNDTEKALLIEASYDSSGTIMKVSSKGGFGVQTNGKEMNEDYEPRTRALWESTFNSLLQKGLIEERGQQGTMFAITSIGYKIADELKEGELNA